MERYMENNQNLKSFFKEGGKKITQFQIEAKLEEVIDWMNDLASDEMKYIRFTKQTIGWEYESVLIYWVDCWFASNCDLINWTIRTSLAEKGAWIVYSVFEAEIM